VAIELDKNRLPALMSKKRPKMDFRAIRQVGVKGFVFAMIGAWAEKKLGNLVGVAPGSEMKHAVLLARKNKIRIALVDQDITITLQRLSKSITWKEKWNFIVDVFKAMFSRNKEMEFDLRTVPEKRIIKKLTSKLKERYPNIYKVLIEERNIAIANNVKNIMQNHPDKKILVVLGAGHVDEVLELVKSEEPNISFSFSVG
jgi:pheromone shutdown protein TraB